LAFKALRLLDGSYRNLEEVLDPEPAMILEWDAEWREYVQRLNFERGESAHWNWGYKAQFFHHRDDVITLGLVTGGRCHGMMICHWPMPSDLAPGEETLCVDYLEAAPWNRKDVCGGEREFAEIGPMLIYAAVRFSEALGFKGRLTLSALPSAERFYQRIGMSETGVERQPNGLALKTFEFSEAGAAVFLDANGRLR
jgi:hypothetical protein